MVAKQGRRGGADLRAASCTEAPLRQRTRPPERHVEFHYHAHAPRRRGVRRLPAGDDARRVIPSENIKRLEVDASDFAKAVDRVATVSSERSRAVKLSLDEDRLILSVNAPDSGAAEEELAVAYGDEPLEIGFNAKYLLEIASQVDRENAVFLFNSSGDPTLMREGNDTSAVYVVMPMRV